jgi:hypothetical protein
MQNGSIAGIRHVLRETTCLSMAASAPRYSLELTRALLESVPHGTFDLAHRITRPPVLKGLRADVDLQRETAARMPLYAALLAGNMQTVEVMLLELLYSV